VWEVVRAPGSGQPQGLAPRAELDATAPVLDVAWKDDGAAVFVAGCTKTVKLWDLAANRSQDVASVLEDGTACTNEPLNTRPLSCSTTHRSRACSG
jgi:hypothetical protein